MKSEKEHGIPGKKGSLNGRGRVINDIGDELHHWEGEFRDDNPYNCTTITIENNGFVCDWVFAALSASVQFPGPRVVTAGRLDHFKVVTLVELVVNFYKLFLLKLCLFAFSSEWHFTVECTLR